jgi:peroxiredoxin
MKKLSFALLAGAVALTLTSCVGLIAGPTDNSQSSQPPQSNATSADYLVLVDAAEQVVADAAEQFVPESVIVTVEPTAVDLETDRHRMSCSDTTSQYTNTVRYYLVDGIDEIAIIDEIRDTYVAEGWERADSLEESMGEEQDPEGTYAQTLRSPENYGLSVSRGDDGAGGTILQMTVYSPCIGNPSDKASGWGK